MPAQVDVADLAAWIAGIDFALWPQQHRLEDGKLRPAMVTDLAWHGFGERTDAFSKEIARGYLKAAHKVVYNRMLSVVMPGHSIPPHVDAQESDWIRRIHVPLVTNEKAYMIIDGVAEHWRAGQVYFIDTRVEHAIRNDGDTPRIHFMFDVRRAA